MDDDFIDHHSDDGSARLDSEKVSGADEAEPFDQAAEPLGEPNGANIRRKQTDRNKIAVVDQSWINRTRRPSCHQVLG